MANEYRDYNDPAPNYYYPWRDDHSCSTDSPMGCDYLNTAKWYRFVGGAGTRMPTTPPGYQRCGGQRPGWMAAPHAAVGNHARAAQVCFQTSSSSYCGYRTTIETCTCSYDAGSTVTHLYKLPRSYTSYCNYCVTTDAMPPPPPPLLEPSLPPALPPRPPDSSNGEAASLCHADCPQNLTSSIALTDPSRHVRNVWRNYDQWDQVPGPNVYDHLCDMNSPQPMAGHGLQQANWYRFEGDAGTHMPTSSPGQQTCGTNYPGWLQTGHPARGSRPYQSKVCFATSTTDPRSCGYSTQIETCTCSYDGGVSNVYLYRLPQPYTCNARYCGTHDKQSFYLHTPPHPPPSPPYSPPPPRPPPPPSAPPPYQPIPSTAVCHSSCPNPTAVHQLTEEWRSVNWRYNYQYTSYNHDYQTPPISQHSSLSDAEWVRFAGDAGTQMPRSPPGYQRCGTERSGWLATPMPEAGAPATPGRVCFHYYHSTHQCYWQTDIMVCTCKLSDAGTPIYLYKLPRPPDNNMVYCGTP